MGRAPLTTGWSPSWFARYRLEMQRARSLLFVAATRARDSLDIFWHGDPSPFLEALIMVRPPVAA